MTILKFQKLILDWYKKNKRSMPWRNTQDPYKILISEVMLQQTQVQRVLPKYQEFLKAFPALKALAGASDKKLLKVWAGLGYWKRALGLKRAAKQIMGQYKGKFPRDPDTLEQLPGIGPYTARAIACFAFQSKDAFLDTNIQRVYLHFFFQGKENISDKEIESIAQKAVWTKNPREWHYALFDYGAIKLKDKSINKQSRHYHKQSKFKGSLRSFRTKVIRLLLSKTSVSSTVLQKFLTKELKQTSYSPEEIIDSLIKDKLIKQKGRYYSL